MWRGAARELAAPAAATTLRAALVIAPSAAESADAVPGVITPQWCRASHPVPNASSLLAGAAARQFVAATAADETLLVLLSGGASALCESLIDGVSLTDLQALQRSLLAASLSIAEINAIRQGLSHIKAGGLARCCPAGIPVRQLVMSDVPGDALSVIGSAPFVPVCPPTPDWSRLPAEWRQWLQARWSPVACAAASASLPRIETDIIASNAMVRAGLQAYAERQHWPVPVNTTIAGDCVDVASCVAEQLRRGPPGLYLFGGECHLQLPAKPGRGGRNQHLALLLAQALCAQPELSVLCLATDGVDGQSDAAGAMFDVAMFQGEIADGAELNQPDQLRRIAAAVASASSYDCWRQLGGLLFTGATAGNVADLVLCWKSAPAG